MGNMNVDLSRGSIGERVAWDILIRSKYSRSVVDVRDDKKFQSLDVDFLWENNKRQFQWIEVKTDFKAHETGNMVYEVSTSGNIGCFEKTKARYIMYYLYHTNTMYYIDVFKLRKYVNDNKWCWDLLNMGDNAKGYLIKIDDLVQSGVILHYWKEI